MTPGAPTDGARSRFPGHRGSTEAGTTLKDSGKRRRSSKGLTCGSALIDEAGPGVLTPLSTGVARLSPVAMRLPVFDTLSAAFSTRVTLYATRRGPQALACGPLPHG